MSNKVYVKLKDTGSIFHDASQEQTITGTKVVAFKKTGKVKSAIKNGVLVEVDAPEDAPTKEAEKTETKPVNYSTLKKAELHALLTEREIDFDESLTNAELVDLLTADDNNKQ